MKQPIDKLVKFLRLEVERGYDDRAVVGGLKNILESWENEARAAELPNLVIQAVTARLRDYHQLTPASREEILRGLWKRVQRSMPGEVPDLFGDVETGAKKASTDEPRPAPARSPQVQGVQRPERRQPVPQVENRTGVSESANPPAQGSLDTSVSVAPPAQGGSDSGASLAPPAQGSLDTSVSVAPPAQGGSDSGASLAPPAQGSSDSGASLAPPAQGSSDSGASLAPPAQGGSGSGASPTPPAAQSAGPVDPQNLPGADPFEPADPIEAEEQERTGPRKGRRQFAVPPILPPEEAAALDAPLTVLSGIGPKTAERLAELGIRSLGDALFFFPRRYDDYSRLEPINRLMYGQTVTVIGSVEQVQLRPTRTGRKVVEALISDGSGAIRATWFNQPWLVDHLRDAGNVSLSGKIDQYLGRLVMNSPDWEALESRNLHTRRIVPVYPLTGQISQKWLRGKIKEVVDYWAGRVQDPLPEDLIVSGELMPVSVALRQIHFPDSWEDLEAARHRLAFDELFSLQLAVLQQRRNWTQRTATRLESPADWLEEQIGALPFALTGAQRKAVAELCNDLASGHPMNRLLQGDVGSGKTVVAALAVAVAARSGAQSAVMAPTSILAEQHFQGLSTLFAAETGAVRTDAIALLVGSTPESEKARIRERLADGSIKLLIGTHAIIEPDIRFRNLELIVVDEQHRFGVRQRAAIREKGANPHLLVMTATPIPRTLALTVYGDLDLSLIDEMPPGRQEIGTYILRPVERERAYTLIRREVENGRQAFMVYPLVEETETSESKAAVEEHARLSREVFRKIEIDLLHGRMSGDEKDAVMDRFRTGVSKILVSTSVVEVGVDVPNATVMLIEGANRFGLATLHQFRGRVGRGAEKSYCLLVPDKDDAVENQRLQAMTETNDGFLLAEKDLAQRGPGEFLGVRQSGYSTLKLASITDVRLVEKARAFAHQVFGQDPELSAPAHARIAEQVRQIWSSGEGDVS